jgi:hypothetical protein
VEEKLHTFLISALDESEWSVSRFGSFTSGEITLWNRLDRGLLGRGGEEKYLPFSAGNEIRVIQSLY